MSVSTIDPEDGDLLAPEAALGVLDAPGRAAVEDRASRDRVFAAEIDAWLRRLAPLFDAIASVTPSTDLWPAIRRRLDAGVGELASARAARDRRSLSLWRAAAAALGAIAAALALVLVWPRPASPPPATLMTARLVSPAGAPAFVAAVEGGDIVLLPTGAAPVAGRAPELWVIPDGGAPIALGVGRFDRPVRLRRLAAAGERGRLTLAVSVEPPGGSTTGAPTGPVIATGKLQRL